MGKGSKQLGQRSEVGKDGCQLILKVKTLNKSQTKGPDPIFSHPAWAVDSTPHSREHLSDISVIPAIVLKDSENIRPGGASGSI